MRYPNKELFIGQLIVTIALGK